MKWINWKVALINFLESHPGRNGFSINYVVCDNINPIVRNNPNLLADYSDRTPLQGRVFTHDSAKFHLYIIFLVSENTVAEQKVLPYKNNANGQEEFLSIKDFYEGVGGNSKAVLAV